MLLLEHLNFWLKDHINFSDPNNQDCEQLEDTNLISEVIDELRNSDFDVKAVLTNNANEDYVVLKYEGKKYQCLIWYNQDDKVLVTIGKFYQKSFIFHARKYGIM